MRLAVISDVHANLEALRAALASIAAEGVDRILCLGDIVGYHADPGECIALLRRSGAICVLGNHDGAVAGRTATDGFSADAARGVAWTRERLGADAVAFLAGLPRQVCVGDAVVAVHGALLPGGGGCETTRLDTPERRRPSFEALAAHPSGARVCAFGHTHRLGIHEFGGVERTRAEDEVRLRDDALYLINPGSVGQPRGGERRATYIVLDTARRTAAVRRVEHDARPALEKARKAGLLPPPPALASPVRAAAGRALRRFGLYAPVKRMLRPRRRGAV